MVSYGSLWYHTYRTYSTTFNYFITDLGFTVLTLRITRVTANTVRSE
jgi:hypothetical protein